MDISHPYYEFYVRDLTENIEGLYNFFNNQFFNGLQWVIEWGGEGREESVGKWVLGERGVRRKSESKNVRGKKKKRRVCVREKRRECENIVKRV